MPEWVKQSFWLRRSPYHENLLNLFFHTIKQKNLAQIVFFSHIFSIFVGGI